MFRKVLYWGRCRTFCTLLSLNKLILRYGLHAGDSVPVSDERVAVHSFVVCVHDVSGWMRASRLWLNLTKTQVMWLGSGQQLKQVDTNDIPLLSTTVPVVESACDLEVFVDSRLTLSANVGALCRAGYYQLQQLRPLNR